MAITVREMRDADARSFLAVHHAAVRGTAAKDYPPAVIDAWAPLPIADKDVAQFLSNPDGELRLVAEVDGEIVGIGALVAAKHELRACYVAPEAGRRGVGAALVQQLESVARDHGLTFLQLDSSLTAESFYRSLGYEVRQYGAHVLPSGQRMACVRMAKGLVSP